jgi:type IV pilus assembly protein PilC
MPVYSYTARDTVNGKVVKSDVKADSERIARKLLLERNLVPSKMTQKDKASNFSFGSGVKSKARILMTRQLSTLINAGLPLAQSLKTVADQSSSEKLKEIMQEIIHDVEAGGKLSDGFGKHPKVFSQVYIALIAAGEASGTLDETLERIASQQEKDAEINSKIKGAMIYPIIVLFVIFGVLVFLLTTVLPQIDTLYQDLNKPLPLITKILFVMSTILTKWWALIIVVVGLMIYGAVTYSRTDDGKKFFDKLKMKAPLFGRLFMKMYMARFARTAGTLLRSGVPMLDMLEVTARAVNNVHVELTIKQAASKVKTGSALSSSLQNQPTFLSLVPQMVRIGEQSGALDAMLNKTADFYEDELDNEIKAISTIIEPALMVVMAMMAGVIVGAILLPVYGLVGESLAL